VELRGFAYTLTAVCPSCLSVIDASTPELQILQKFTEKQRVQPKIPLGSRGPMSGTTYEVIGFQQREVVSGDDVFCWDEYLLFNPYQGFRYLSEYQGHWNFIRVLSALPVVMPMPGKPIARVLGRRYRGFDRVKAQTAFVLGEFPWQLRVGESVLVEDFVSPPYMLSSETTEAETTWSFGEYIDGSKIWQAFKLPGSAPAAYGVFANQPSPYAGKLGSAWRTWLWLSVALFAIMMIFSFSKSNREVFHESYTFVPARNAESAFVTPAFALTGRDSNVEVAIQTDLENDWIYFGFALINEDTGQAFDFAREVSYYRDSDGTEGGRNSSVVVPGVPAGKYYLRVEPEMTSGHAARYELALRRDVPTYGFFWIAAGLLLIPPIFKTVRSASFETARWRESDYAPVRSTSDGGDD
jgi:hypothetical protein